MYTFNGSVMYLNIASYLYEKQIKSKMGNQLYLQMIFFCVRLKWLDIHECHTMLLNIQHNINIYYGYNVEV